MKVLTFDLETENHVLHKRLAGPFDERNYVVEAGWMINNGKRESVRFEENHRDPFMQDALNSLEEGDVINGFNLKFDLLWLWRQPEMIAALKRGVTVYCGQLAEYMLGGMQQDVQMASMNDTAEQYGGGCKIDAVKELWENGALTSEIPPDMLHDYLIGTDEVVGDIRNTWLIMCGQIKRMKEYFPPEFRTMIKMRMEALCATTEMEFNGVHCDSVVGEGLRDQVVIDLAEAEETLREFIPKLPHSVNYGEEEETPDVEFNWNSNTHKSCLIYGGVIKYTKWTAHADDNGNPIYPLTTYKLPLFGGLPIPEEKCIKAGELYVREVPQDTKGSFAYKGKQYITQDRIKSGKNMGVGKTKNVTEQDNTKQPKGAQQPYYFKFDGYVKPHGSWKSESTDAYDNPLYKCGAEIIEKLATRGLPFTNALSSRTKLDKDLGTYYWKETKGKRKGILTLVDSSGIIHHKLNHTSTVTSRLSSSDPNLQNVPRADTSNVKKMFTSRFKDGRMGEIDYSQLEVVVQGVLTKDPQLTKDLQDRIDFHCKRLAAKLNEEYGDVLRKCKAEKIPEYIAMRTGAKEFSFQRAYGAGVDAIVTSTGMLKSDVEALVAVELRLYPGIAMFDQYLENEIQNSRIPTSRKIFIEGIAFTQGSGHWDSPMGTRYVWVEHETPTFMHKSGKYIGFSPTERKNYPVQGDGGLVVQCQLGKLWRHMLMNDNYDGNVLLVNTVHDCVWLDGKEEYINAATLAAQAILEEVPAVFNKAFPKLNVVVPFPCESEVGKDMYTMEEIAA